MSEVKIRIRDNGPLLVEGLRADRCGRQGVLAGRQQTSVRALSLWPIGQSTVL